MRQVRLDGAQADVELGGDLLVRCGPGRRARRLGVRFRSAPRRPAPAADPVQLCAGLFRPEAGAELLEDRQRLARAPPAPPSSAAPAGAARRGRAASGHARAGTRRLGERALERTRTRRRGRPPQRRAGRGSALLPPARAGSPAAARSPRTARGTRCACSSSPRPISVSIASGPERDVVESRPARGAGRGGRAGRARPASRLPSASSTRPRRRGDATADHSFEASPRRASPSAPRRAPARQGRGPPRRAPLIPGHE